MCLNGRRPYYQTTNKRSVGSQPQRSFNISSKQMQEAAKKLEFIEAAQYRDELLRLEDMLKSRWG